MNTRMINAEYSADNTVTSDEVAMAIRKLSTVKPLYSEQSRDPKKCSLYRGVHPGGVRYVHVHMCLQYTKNGSVLASKGLIRW